MLTLFLSIRFPQLEGLVLFNITVALLALTCHTQYKPYDSELIDTLVAASHLQTLTTLIVLLLEDANMFGEGSWISYSTVGIVIAITNLLMLMLMITPVAGEGKWTPREPQLLQLL